jgi:hypothetical protein
MRRRESMTLAGGRVVMSNTSQTNQAHARRFNGAIRFVLTVLIATLLGPFIGAILMMLGRIGLDLARWEFDPADIRGVIVIFMMGAYAVGGVIAFAAGVLVALGALWREATFAMVVVAIVLANLGCYLLVQPMVSYGPLGLLQNIVVSLVAGTILWLCFRRYLRSR